MTTEELKTILAQAERGDVPSMIRLTHIYGENEGYLDYSQALKWFLTLIQAEFNFHKQAQYDQKLLKKVTDCVLSAKDESDVPGMFQKLNMQPASSRSLFSTSIYFSSSVAKNTISAIYRIEKELQEEERIAKVKKAEAEAAAKRAEDARKKAEAEAREAEAKARQAEAEAKRAEEARKKAEVEAEAKKAEEARKKAEAEAELARRKAEEEERRRKEEERRREEERIRKEEEARRKAEEEERRRKEEERRREEERIRKEEEARRKAEEEERRRKELERQEMEWRAMMKQNIEEDYEYGAFNPNSFLSDHLDIPDCVTKIGARAFESCWLTSIYVPDSVQTIGESAFAHSAIRCIGISGSVQYIAPNAFDSCFFLEQIMIPRGTKQHFLQMEGFKGLESLIVEE